MRTTIIPTAVDLTAQPEDLIWKDLRHGRLTKPKLVVLC